MRAVMAAALGADDHLLDRFDKVRYSLSIWTDSTPESAWIDARLRGISQACGIIDATLYQLHLRVEDSDEPVDTRSFDPDLWQHVKQLVEDEDWAKVPSQVSIFVEDRIRQWAGEPTDSKGEGLIGKGLMARAFADDSELRLGSRKGEWEGWRALGMGFAQALSNVDRHRIQKRDDARRYAIGVLGLGSLLLTQVRYEHGELLEERQTGVEEG
ncbi:MAG: hypothetical protein E7Z95_04370 [Actinomyces succiniciruminis]|nr:hypothetical protein [Actinomyces succiniciruminis]